MPGLKPAAAHEGAFVAFVAFARARRGPEESQR